MSHLVTNLRIGTKSGESNTMMLVQFLLNFVNTAVIVILLNANFSESNIPWIRNYFSVGTETDFNQKWYTDVGPILVGTQFIGAFMPIITHLISYLITKLLEFHDRNWTCSEDETR